MRRARYASRWRAIRWLGLFWLLALPAHAEWLTGESSAMGTEIRATVWHQDSARGQKAIDAVMAEMRRVDAALSPWIATSELSRVNATAAQRAVPVSNELSYLLQRSVHYSNLSGGAFDITFASVGSHYDYREGRQPDAQTRDKLLPAINYRLLKLDDKASSVRFAHEKVRIDLGGIAKGHAVDRAITILRRHGVEHATVSAGGDSRVLGDKRGQPWMIGVKNPRQQRTDEREVVLTLPLANTAVSTSGDYERYFIDQRTGQRIHHIINPRTGRSADEVMSATVMGPRAIDTDALSTTVFVLGVEKGLTLINRLESFDAVVIDRSGKVRYSAGLSPP